MHTRLSKLPFSNLPEFFPDVLGRDNVSFSRAWEFPTARNLETHVASRPDKFATVIVDKPMESWLRRMARPKEWSDNAVLQAIADRFKLCMFIWHADLPEQRLVLVNSFDEPAERHVHLMLHKEPGGEHYNLLMQEKQKHNEDRLHPVAKRRDRQSAKRRAEHDA